MLTKWELFLLLSMKKQTILRNTNTTQLTKFDDHLAMGVGEGDRSTTDEI